MNRLLQIPSGLGNEASTLQKQCLGVVLEGLAEAFGALPLLCGSLVLFQLLVDGAETLVIEGILWVSFRRKLQILQRLGPLLSKPPLLAELEQETGILGRQDICLAQLLGGLALLTGAL